MPAQTIALRARYVLPVCQPPIAGGVIVVREGRIVSVGTDALGVPVEDLGDVALLPGLVNAHTHLEFSNLAAPLGTPGALMTEWIGEVLGYRRAHAGIGPSAVPRGLQESLMTGTTCVGEIATTDWRTAELPPTRPVIHMFFEAIGPTVPRAHAAADAAERFLRAAPLAGVQPGLSPHAPYTVHTRLLESLIALSQRHRVPLAMHLAESREELELLNLGSGPFRDMLEAVGAWEADESARLSCILDYLTELSRAERALVVHGNYLDDEEIAFLGDHNERMAVVYCPRTHEYFEHEPYPLGAMLQAGVTLALGTDSRASTPDLSLLEEIYCVAELHPGTSPGQIFELATLGGARALGIAEEVGTLAIGKRADLLALPCARETVDPAETILEDVPAAAGVWLAGNRVMG